MLNRVQDLDRLRIEKDKQLSAKTELLEKLKTELAASKIKAEVMELNFFTAFSYVLQQDAVGYRVEITELKAALVAAETRLPSTAEALAKQREVRLARFVVSSLDSITHSAALCAENT